MKKSSSTEVEQLFISVGGMSESVKKQVVDQGWNIDIEEVKLFDKLLDALILLRIQGYIPDRQYDKSMRKVITNSGVKPV